MYRSFIWLVRLVFLLVSLNGHGVNAQQGGTEMRAEETRSKEAAQNLIVAAKLYWNGSPLDGAKTIEITSRKDLAMLSVAIHALRDIDVRSFGFGDPQKVWGRLYIATKECRYQIEIGHHGYWFDCEFPQFRQRFLSVPLTNTLDTILRRSGSRIQHHQKVRLTGYERILREEEDWKKIKAGQFEGVGPGSDFGDLVMPFLLDPEMNPALLKSSLSESAPTRRNRGQNE